MRIPLFNYIIYPQSLSKDGNSYEKKRFRLEEHQDIILHVLADMPMDSDDRDYYIKFTEQLYATRMLELAAIWKNIPHLCEAYTFLKERKALTMRYRAFYLIGRSKLLNTIYKKLR